MNARPNDLPQVPAEPPLLIVLSGPSGAGKDSVLDLVIRWQPEMQSVVTTTTRGARRSEIEGRDYKFVSEDRFDEMLTAGALLEHTRAGEYRNGVPRDQVDEALRSRRDAIVRVDVRGAQTLKGLMSHALVIFIAPPSVEETARRIRFRAQNAPEEQQKRIDRAHHELQAAKEFDHVVVNETGKLEEAARRVVEIIVAEKRRRIGRPLSSVPDLRF